jgi:hypothetical protein
MSAINFPKKYHLKEEYEAIKEQIIQALGKYVGNPGLITFNDTDKSVTFTSEKLIPTASTHRPRVMLLLSNPHPYSVQQSMFLSPNKRGVRNPFWSVMEDAGWITNINKKCSPEQLREICLKVQYQGPFELIFYCYYAFPTKDPKDIRKIFGKEYFRQEIEKEAKREFKKAVQETGAKIVVVFNKEIFNIVAKDPVERYINYLKEGGLIESQIKSFDRLIPAFLTFPTGWRFCSRQLRKTSLDRIRETICGE